MFLLAAATLDMITFALAHWSTIARQVRETALKFIGLFLRSRNHRRSDSERTKRTQKLEQFVEECKLMDLINKNKVSKTNLVMTATECRDRQCTLVGSTVTTNPSPISPVSFYFPSCHLTHD